MTVVIKDTRDNRTLQGEHVDTIPANQPVSQEGMQRYYKMAPGSKNYELLSAPIAVARLVLDRGDEAYYIIPKYEFYQEVRE